MIDITLAEPRPGLHVDLPFDEYLKLNALSTSELGKLESTLAHWRVALDSNPSDSESIKIGKATELLVQDQLFNEFNFAKQMGILDHTVNLRTKIGKAVKEDLESQFGAGNILKSSEFKKAKKAADALLKNNDSNELLRGVSKEWWQPSFCWKDIKTGLMRKCRWDALSIIGNERWIIDIKTIRSGGAAPQFLNAHAYAYGYHRQAFAYLEAAQRCGIHVNGIKFLFVDSSEPYSVAVRTPKDEALLVACAELDQRTALAHYAVNSLDYPGYESMGEFNVPKWARERGDHGMLPSGGEAFIQEF
jgi:tetratricopeptide (TPR) repeat protein